MRIGFASLAALAVMSGASVAADLAPADPGLISDIWLEVNGGYTWLGKDFGGEDDKFGFLGGAAKASLPLGTNFSMQLDAIGEATEHLGQDDESDYGGGITGALHLDWRDPSSHALGLFGGASAVDLNSNDNGHAFFIGLEGQLYLGQNTLYLQGGYLDGEDSDDNDVMAHSAFVHGGWNYYFSDDMRLATHASYANGKLDDDKTHIVDWGVELEGRPDGWPVTLFAAYDGLYAKQNNENDKLLDTTVKVGLRFDFGGPTIIDRDRRGAGMTLPNFNRWLGLTGGPME
jgi:hypothetical protein